MSTFESRIVRVLRGGSVVGAGFLAGDQWIATCAHVIRSAGKKPGETVTLQLEDGIRVEAQIVPAYWRDDNAEDVAILHLEQPLDVDGPLVLGSSASTRGHSFSTFGFPKPTQELAGRGEIVGTAVLNQIKLLQLDSRQVTPGFSGAPVFDEATRRVVGMVVAITPPDEYQRQGTTAFAVTSETLREVCGELQLVNVCPFRSLDVFNEEDAPYFFGRERVTQKLLESLKREPRFLAVLGPSGSGKSSLLRAGLIPALRDGKLPGSKTWGILTIRPGAQPFEQLENEGLKAPQNGLVQSAQAWLAEHADHSRLVLVLDQFEEILVSTSSELRHRFIAELSNLLEAPLAITLVLSMRDDFYSQLLKEAPSLGGWIERGLVNIPLTITKAELEDIVQKPAQAAGLAFEEGLADTIVADVLARDQDDSARITILPLLEFALTQLWEARQDNLLTHEAYREMEGVTGGLARWANDAYDALDKNERDMARLILELLVHPADEDQGIPDIRQARPIPAIIRENEILTQTTINKLVQARLLTVKRDPRTGEEILEIIHDALLAEWGALRSWLDEDRPSLQIQQQLSDAADEWKLRDCERSYLFRGKRLEDVQAWLEKHGKALSQLEREFLAACEEEKKRQRKSIRILWSVVGILVLVLVVIGPVNWGRREIARQRARLPLVPIPAGTAIVGSDDPQLQDHNTTFLDYGIDPFEVSNRQYRACVEHGPCTPLLNRSDYDDDDKLEYPVVWVAADQANTYCQWLGRRLPTSVEWERAVRGTDGRTWPWGNEFLQDVDFDLLTTLQPVKSVPETATREEPLIYHLVDNVAEWVVRVEPGCQKDECQSTWNGRDDITAIVGGAYDRFVDPEHVNAITSASPNSPDKSIGFRCVGDIEP